MSRKASRKVSRKVSRKASRKVSRKASRKVSRKVSRKPSRKVSRKASRKVSRKVSRKASRKVSRKASRKVSRKASRKASRKVSRKASRKVKKFKIASGLPCEIFDNKNMCENEVNEKGLRRCRYNLKTRLCENLPKKYQRKATFMVGGSASYQKVKTSPKKLAKSAYTFVR